MSPAPGGERLAGDGAKAICLASVLARGPIMKRLAAILAVVIFPAVAFAAAPAPVPGPPPTGPDWAYPPTPLPPPLPNPDPAQGVPGSDKSYTQAQIDDGFNPPDWYPAEHAAMPYIVAHGRAPAARACALCHLPLGNGHPESASLAGLTPGYIVEQMQVFKDNTRRNNRAAVMHDIAAAIGDADVKAAAEYFAALTPKPWERVVEAATVAKSYVGPGAMRFQQEGVEAGTEPIGNRIIELPEDERRAHQRDAHSGFVAYVPPGSIARGRMLVTMGDGGKTIPCGICHGQDLRGLGDVPRLAGRSPIYLYRQLNDIKAGLRSGDSVALMTAVVANLAPEDMVAIAAYVGSQTP